MKILSAFSGYGIELEYMIVDEATLSIKPIADVLCSDTRSTGLQNDTIGCSNELVMHVIELKNQEPTHDLERLAEAFQQKVHGINAALRGAGARLMPSAMHPWMSPDNETCLWPHHQAEIYQAYDRIFNCRTHGHANVQSMQINLPFADDKEFSRLHEAIRLALPLIPALAASSPFAEGRWTGFMDYRLESYRGHQSRVPSTVGDLIPEHIATQSEYRSRILDLMFRDIAEYDPEGVLQHEWLNVRAAVPRFDRSAIEIRIADVQECPQADIAVATAIIALVKHLYDTGMDKPPADTQRLSAILRNCIVNAEQTVIDDDHYLRRFDYPGHRCKANELWQFLIETMLARNPMLQPCLPTLHHILRHGPLARRVLETVGITANPHRLREAYLELCQCLQSGILFQRIS